MPTLAQLADLFDQTTWRIIHIAMMVMWLMPALAMVWGYTRHKTPLPYAAQMKLAIYYGICVLSFVLVPLLGEIVGCSWYLLAPLGLMVGFNISLIANRERENAT